MKKTGNAWRRVSETASVQDTATPGRAQQPEKEVSEER